MSMPDDIIAPDPTIPTFPDNTLAPPPTKRPRLASLDQLRGLTVAAMFVVNFSGGFKAMPDIIKHHDGYETLADWVMPTFLFMVGFSFRLSWLSTVKRVGSGRAVMKFLVRGLLLVGISLFLYAGDDDISIDSWEKADWPVIRELLAVTLKANLWETLAIIGCAQMLMIPFIGRSWGIRFLVFLGLLAGHTVISYKFNWNFVHGLPNVLDDYWGAKGKRAWDGGFFGLIGWSALIIAGSLAHDFVMSRKSIGRAVPGLVLGGALVAFLGWGVLGSLTRLYDVPADASQEFKQQKLAESPVWPDFSKAEGRELKDLLPEPPMVPIPGPEERKFNYWMIYKRMVSVPFVLFNAGVAMVLLGLFIVISDLARIKVPAFERFGQNALAAYCVHHYLGDFQKLFVPRDSPAWWCWLNLLLFMIVIDRVLAWMKKKDLSLTV
jgi:predicted acyltransferase